MITNITKASPFGVDGTHHVIKEYIYDKVNNRVKVRIFTYPNANANTNKKTPLFITETWIPLADLPVSLRQYLNDGRDQLENYLVTQPDWTGGIVS